MLCILPHAGFSQEPAGVVLTGVVEDQNRLPVTGVVVTLRTGNQTHRLSTNELGRFRFDSATPGSHQLDFDKPGYFRLSDYTVVVTPEGAEVTVTLARESEIRSAVDVVAAPHEVDPQQTSHEERLEAYEIRENPVRGSHSLQNALQAIPGVVKDRIGILHVAGGRDEDTAIVLDGFQLNEPATGAYSGRVNVDAVRTVEVVTGRYGAQYANAGAGVLELNTETGDDRWRFGTTNFMPSLELDRGIHLGNWYPRVTFSGPLRRGRAWFSNGLSLQHGFSLVRELPPGADTSHYWSGDNLFRVQYNLTPSHSLQGNFLYNGNVSKRSGLGPFAPASTTTDSISRRYFLSLKDQFSFAHGHLEFGIAGDDDSFKLSPQGSEGYVLTPRGPLGNYFERIDVRGQRWQGRADLIVTGRHWHGAHTFQTGLNVDRGSMTQIAERQSFELRNTDALTTRRTSFLGSGRIAAAQQQAGAYVQHAWQLRSSVVAQMGLRFDWNEFTGRTLAQPRFVVNWLPDESSTKLSAGWGTYYQAVYPSLISVPRDQARLDWLDRNASPILTTFAAPTVPKQPYFETVSVEWQQQWSSRITSSAHFMNRKQRQGLAYENLSTDALHQDFQLGSNRRDRYRALDLSLRYSLQEDSDLMISYTYSRARSNILFDFSPAEFLLAGRTDGPLAWDAPHRVISRGAVQTSLWDLLFSYFAEYHTGFPFSAVDSYYRLSGEPNGFRYPDYFSANLAAEKRFRFRGHEWAVRVSAMNFTGHRNYSSVINNVDAPDFLAFAGGQRRALTARLRLVGRK